VSQIDKIKLILNNRYKNIQSNALMYNHSLKVYGNPDLLTDDYVIDIKISKNNKILSAVNYLQLISYEVLLNKNKICFYDMENGIVYEGELKNIDNIRKHFYTNFIMEHESKELYNKMHVSDIKRINYEKKIEKKEKEKEMQLQRKVI